MSKSINLPPFLYRGDGDRDGTRLLKATVGFGQFQSNLISGGIGRQIFEKPITALIAGHVSPGWPKSHFLSFTTEKLTAIRFGINKRWEPQERVDEHLDAYYDSGDDFDFALLELDTDRVDWYELEQGVYEGFYPTSLSTFQRFSDQFRVVLFDVSNVLRNSANNADYRVEIANAERDREWLILPANNLPEIEGYSGKLDGNCLSVVTRYRYRPPP